MASVVDATIPSHELRAHAGAQRKRLAIVARRAPLPPFSGIGLIVHNITVRLARRYDVQVFLTDDNPPATAVLGGLPVNACGASGYGDDGARVKGGSFRNQIARFYGVPMEREDWLRDQLAAFRPDVVLGYGYDTAPYLEGVRKRYPTVADVIDAEVLYLWRQIRQGAISVTMLKHLMTSIRLARQLSACDAIVTVADEDSRNLRRLASHSDVATISNGVDCDFYAPNDDVRSIDGRVIFTGSLNWMPNVQAVEWFLEGCWAHILQARPDATLVIVGKGMQPAQKQAFESHPNVTALGFVDDVRSHVLAAQVSIAPMISGSGIKNKILEAWSMCRAVVATTTASRGLHGGTDSIRVADDRAGFAREVIALLGDAPLRARLGANGRRAAVERYSWDAAGDAFAAVLERAYGAHSSRMRS
jgi:polysaccharide biosynthesis protein PslH